jgi:hypothetical protein
MRYQGYRTRGRKIRKNAKNAWIKGRKFYLIWEMCKNRNCAKVDDESEM